MIHDRNLLKTSIVAVALLAFGGLEAVAQDLPAGHVPIPQLSSPEGIAVVVLETLNGGGYTYARVAIDGDEAWMAGPQTMMTVGDTVLVSNPMPMESFTSSSLNRTFDVLFFVGGYQKQGATTAIDGPRGEVREVLNSGGYTYILVENEGVSLWIAGPTTDVGGAEVVSWRGGSMMRDFRSRTLARTFTAILFVQDIAVVR